MSSTTTGATAPGPELREGPRRGRRRTTLLAGMAAALLCVVAACGGGGTAATGQSAAPSAPPAASADTFPQTLTSPYGETTLAAAPKRVVALGVAERDTTLALGVTPVAVGGYGDIDPWFTKALGSQPAVENLEISDGIPFEKIASFDPDLIITGWGEEADYAQLSAIAPVLWQVSDSFSTEWREQVPTIAKALGRSAEGQKLVADTDAKIKAAASPAYAGKTFTFTSYDPSAISLVDLPTAPVNQFVEELGLTLKPEIANPASSYTLEVSPEQLDALDANVIILWPSSPDAKAQLEGLRTWQNLAGVKAGGAVFLDDTQAAAINSPTLLSIPYVLEFLTPMLTQATKA